MSVVLTVAGNSYDYPTDGQNADWGAEASDWAVAVTNVLNEVIGTNDILLTSANIGNGQTSQNIIGLVFDPTSVRGAVITYTVYRTITGAAPQELVEIGQMFPAFKNIANTWDMPVIGGQGAGIAFSILPSGQVQYSTTSLVSVGGVHTGIIKFSAKVLPQ